MRLFPSLVFIGLLAGCSHHLEGQEWIRATTKGTGPSIIFLPGLGCPGEVWEPAVDRLTGKYSCTVISIAGFAGLPAVRTPDFDSVRLDIVSFIRKSGMRNPALIGHSMGGVLALSLAASHPDLFSKLIIVDACPFPPGLLNPGLSQAVAAQQALAVKNAFLQQDSPSLERILRSALATAMRDSLRLGQVVKWMTASDRRMLAQAEFVMLSTDLRPDLANITIPALVLGTWAGREPYGLNQATVAARLKDQYVNLRDCSFAISNSSGHFIMYDEPDWLAEQLTEFLTR